MNSEFPVSVCLACYNGENFIEEQVETILMQLRPGDELVISDGGSSDRTLEILDCYSEKIVLLQSHSRLDVVSNFKKAIKYARNSSIVLADQDDVWLDGRLDVIKSFLQENDLVVSNATCVDRNLKPLGFSTFFTNMPRLTVYQLLKKNSIIGCCIAFKKEKFSSVLDFPKITPMHDWLIGFYAVATKRNIALIGFPTLLYRRHEHNVTQLNTGAKKISLNVLLLRLRLICALLICLIR